MGVRGKIEAVIYAAEEPVTLQQLVTLFGEDALAEQAEARAHDAVPETEPLPFPAPELNADENLAELPAAPTNEPAPSEPAPSEAQPTECHPEQSEGPAVPPHPHNSAPKNEPELSEPEPSATQAVQAEAEKRSAKLREREAREAIRVHLDALTALYDESERGMEIREIAGGYRVGTKPEYHDAVRAFVKSLKPVMKLSLQALETLAVIAYKQPVTAPEVSEIRGVDSGGVLGSLISRKLVTTAGRKQVVGRPILYKTTKEFLLKFGLKDLNELPSMEEFEKMAGELTSLRDEEPEVEPDAEPHPESDPEPNLEPLASTATDADTNQDPGQNQSKDRQAEQSNIKSSQPEQSEIKSSHPEQSEGPAFPAVAPEQPTGSASNNEDQPQRARPTLAPSQIVVSVEDPIAPGLSVTPSGTVRPDQEPTNTRPEMEKE